MNNISIIIGLTVAVISLVGLLYVFIKQSFEVSLPPDWLSRLRWLIFSMLAAAIIGVLPVIAYNIARLTGSDSELWRNVATVAGNVSRLASVSLLILVYRYRAPGDDPKPHIKRKLTPEERQAAKDLKAQREGTFGKEI